MSKYDPTAGASPATMTGAQLARELQTIQQQPEWCSSNERKFFDLVHRAEALVTETEAR